MADLSLVDANENPINEQPQEDTIKDKARETRDKLDEHIIRQATSYAINMMIEMNDEEVNKDLSNLKYRTDGHLDPKSVTYSIIALSRAITEAVNIVESDLIPTINQALIKEDKSYSPQEMKNAITQTARLATQTFVPTFNAMSVAMEYVLVSDKGVDLSLGNELHEISTAEESDDHKERAKELFDSIFTNLSKYYQENQEEHNPQHE